MTGALSLIHAAGLTALGLLFLWAVSWIADLARLWWENRTERRFPQQRFAQTRALIESRDR